jgi:hypothetical protein
LLGFCLYVRRLCGLRWLLGRRFARTHHLEEIEVDEIEVEVDWLLRFGRLFGFKHIIPINIFNF